MPNTFTMQEVIRTYFDQYVDNEESGKPVETPVIYRIPKGVQGRDPRRISAYIIQELQFPAI